MGRAEVKLDGDWMLIDRYLFHEDEASVFCRSVGFASGEISYSRYDVGSAISYSRYDVGSSICYSRYHVGSTVSCSRYDVGSSISYSRCDVSSTKISLYRFFPQRSPIPCICEFHRDLLFQVYEFHKDLLFQVYVSSTKIAYSRYM